MIRNLQKSIGVPLVLLLVVGLAFLAWVGPAMADGGGWPTATLTATLTSISTAASPIDVLLTPEPGASAQPAIINPDTGGQGISFEDELATIQVEVQLTSAAQNILLTPTAGPAAQSEGLSPLFMVGGLVISMAVLAFLGFRLLRR